MATKKKQQHPNVVRVSGADALRRTTSQLVKQGFIPAPMPNDFGRDSAGGNHQGPSWEDYVHAQLCTGGNGSYPTLHLSGSMEVPVTGNIGTPGLGYMSWGADNRKPNVISMLTEASPYTASAHRFNTDLCAGRGPRPVYAYVQYVGGNITEKRIPYQNAGILIKGWLRDLRRELQQEQSQQGNTSPAVSGSPADTIASPAPSGSPANTITSPAVSGSPADITTNNDSPLAADIKEQIAALERDYAVWEQTNAFLFGNPGTAERGFLQRNNLHTTYLSLTGDMQQENICFPVLTLNRRTIDENGKNLPTSRWNPQIIGLRYLMVHQCRLERTDKNGRINYVYISNQWLDECPTLGGCTDEEEYKLDALPALDPQAPVTDLERIVRDTRRANGSIRHRPTRFILPIKYPSPGHPYYPVPANQSIYSIYEYLMTMISDRNKRRKNSNVIGRIIYLNQEYMERLYFQQKADTPEDKTKVFTELRKQINTFLSDRDNTGKPLVAYTFLGSDGKCYESWKIVEIEANDKGSVEANQKELAEVSSIIFFAFGLDSRLVGNTPGDVTSSGGTDLRERFLLKQVQMSPMQQILLTPLYVIKDFNRLDTHLEWEIPREVLTTLDNSKTGITTQDQQ